VHETGVYFVGVGLNGYALERFPNSFLLEERFLLEELRFESLWFWG
jgi:hypothetical protein